jgi:hypothetical protein
MTQQEKKEMLEYFNKINKVEMKYLDGLFDEDEFKRELLLNMEEDDFLKDYLTTYIDKIIEYSDFFHERHNLYLKQYIPVLIEYYKKYDFEELNESIFYGKIEITAIKRDNNGKLDFKQTILNDELKIHAAPILRYIIGLADNKALLELQLLVNILDMEKIEQGLNRLLDKQDDPDILYIKTKEYNNQLCIIYYDNNN